MRTKSLIFLILFALGILTLFGFITLKPIFNKEGQNNTLNKNIPLSLDALPSVTFINPVRGSKNAKLAIVEYGDYLCSFCATVEATLKKLLLEYENQIRIVWKDFPLPNIHPLADNLAEAARCAQEEGKFWDYHDLAFSEQENIISEADVLRLARELKLGQDFETCYKNGKMRPRVQADFEEGARLEIDGAPYFFVGDERLSGAVSYERFKEAIDQQLQK
jgi:protein-disulfide isomerase